MFNEAQTEHDEVIGFICVGELMEDDLERMHRLIHDRVTFNSSPGLVLGLTQFVGYETPSAMLEDFRIDKAHTNDSGVSRQSESAAGCNGARNWLICPQRPRWGGLTLAS